MRKTSRGKPFRAVQRPAAAVLLALTVAAAGLTGAVWYAHDRHQYALSMQTRAAVAAAVWAGALINLRGDDLDTGLAKLRDDTAGELHSHFDSSVMPYRDELAALRSNSGHIRSVSIESARPDYGASPARTITVLIVATSVGNDANGTVEAIEWNLRVGVRDVVGRPLISQLERVE